MINKIFVESNEKKYFNEENYDLNKVLLHPIFSCLWLTIARYKIIFGSKDNGKSKAAALYQATKWLENPKRNTIIFRKYNKWNATSTLNDMIWAFNVLSIKFNNPNLTPMTREENRKTGGMALIVYSNSSVDMVIENTITKQKIFFSGMDRIAAGGFSLADPTHAIDKIWYEEPVDLDDGTSIIEDDSSLQKWRLTESTIFRGTRTQNELGETIMKEGFDWVEYETIFTFNSHNPEHWLLSDFGDKFTPLNIFSNEDISIMEKEHASMYYDQTFQDGDGLFVMRTSAFLNPGRDDNLIKRIKKDDIKEYAYLYLGATRNIGGAAYQGLMNKIKTDTVILKNYWPISIGIDHALSAVNGDFFVASFLATPDKRMVNNVFPSYEEITHYDEYYWNNKIYKPYKTDNDMCKEIINKFVNLVKVNNWQHKIKENGFLITIDNSAQSFQQVLNLELQAFVATHMDQFDWMKMIHVVLIEGKNSSVEIEPNKPKIKGRKGRIELNRKYIEADMFRIIRTWCPMSYSKFISTSIDKKGEVIDLDRDFGDAIDYARMTPRIKESFVFGYQIMKNKNFRI